MKVPVMEGVMAEQSTAQPVLNQAEAFVTATNYRNNAKGGFVLGKDRCFVLAVVLRSGLGTEKSCLCRSLV